MDIMSIYYGQYDNIINLRSFIMKNVFFRAVILAFVLVFGMTVISCEDGSGGGGGGSSGEQDTWTDVTSLD